MRVEVILVNPKTPEVPILAGSVIQGYVYFHSAENPRAEELLLRLAGYGHVSFTMDESATGRPNILDSNGFLPHQQSYAGPNLIDPVLPPGALLNKRPNTSRRFHRRQTYFDQGFTLWSKRLSGKMSLTSPFTGAFPFFIKTPSELPPSIKTIHGKISYTVEAIAKRPNDYDVSHRVPLLIEANVPVYRPVHPTWFDISETMELGDLLGIKEGIEFSVSVPTKVFLVGETFEMRIQVSNNCRHRLTSGKVLLVQKVTHLAEGIRKELSNVLLEENFQEVPSGAEQFLIKLRLTLPARKPPSYSSLKYPLMEIEYFLEVSTTPKNFFSPFEMVVPITISTVAFHESVGTQTPLPTATMAMAMAPSSPLDAEFPWITQELMDTSTSFNTSQYFRPTNRRQQLMSHLQHSHSTGSVTSLTSASPFMTSSYPKSESRIGQVALLTEIKSEYGFEYLFVPFNGLGRDKPPSAIAFLSRAIFGNSVSELMQADLAGRFSDHENLNLRLKLRDVVVPFFRILPPALGNKSS